MKKKVVVIIAIIICMSAILSMLNLLFKSWESTGWLRNSMRIVALIGWVYITYNMITLKYNWIKKLTK